MVVLNQRKAVVRDLGDKYKNCISTHPLHSTLNIVKVREQHARYCEILEEIGLEVIRVPRDNDHPDSCFVEDNAVVYNRKALICRMAKQSRRGEELGIESVLKQYMPVKRAIAPATVEGGDVVHLRINS